MKRLALIAILALAFGGLARAQQPPQIIQSPNCATTPHYGNMYWCLDTVINNLFYWNGTAYTEVPSEGGTVTNVPQQANGPAVSNNTTTPTITMPTNTYFAANESGSTADVKIQACLNALPANGGVCDATGLTGTQTISSTIAIGTKQTLLLGHATYNSSVLPAFTYVAGSAVIGLPAVQGNGTTMHGSIVETSSNSSGALIQAASSSGYQGVTIKNILWKGNDASADNNTFGVDLEYAASFDLENNSFTAEQTAVRYGGASFCACYGYSANNFVGSPNSVGYYYGATSNAIVSVADQVHPGSDSTYGFQFVEGQGSDTIIEPDVETFSGGIAIDINGIGDHIINPYIESGATGVQIEANAAKDMITGAGNCSTVTTCVNDTISSTTDYNNFILWLGAGGGNGQTQYPQFMGATNYWFTVGSQNDFFTMTALSNSSLELLETPGSYAETVYGYTGGAGLSMGTLVAKGGASVAGRSTHSALATPSGLTCTATCTSTCTTSYLYEVVCRDGNGGLTLPSSEATCSNNATLSSTNFNKLAWNKEPGCLTWDIIGNTTTADALVTNIAIAIPGSLGSPGTTYSASDNGFYTPAPYTAPTADSTAADNHTPRAISSLPGVCSDGDTLMVNNWNGTNGVCSSETGGSTRVLASCGASNTWYCP